VELYPDFWLVHFAMGLALSQTGRIQESIASLETTLRLSPSFTLATGFLAASYARSDNTDHAEELMEELKQRGMKQYVSPACFGIYYAAAGQAGKMFEVLEAALAERDPYLTRIDAEPYFGAFRTDLRYRSLLERMSLG
jgi:tetratricopeptide (TPR) repeat protein